MAKKKRNNDFFWIGYSDLMTTLFFVMLVLFAIIFISADPERVDKLEKENKELKVQITELKNIIDTLSVTVEQYENIVQIENQFETLRDDQNFEFLPECKKYVAKSLSGKELFKSNESVIKPEYHQDAKLAGQKIKSFIDNLNREKGDFSYLLVIEGNTANWPKGSKEYRDKNDRNGFKLSYDRALALYRFWENEGISFRKANVEVIISGSGFNGICRDENEPNNKRFSIQIIPKVNPDMGEEDG